MAKGGSIQCPACRENFTWTVHGDVWAGGKDKENIVCPACNETASTVMTSGRVQVERGAQLP